MQLEREVAYRRTLQGPADALRDQLAAAQIDAAQVIRAANTERAKQKEAETRAAELQCQVEDLERQISQRPWWRWW